MGKPAFYLSTYQRAILKSAFMLILCCLCINSIVAQSNGQLVGHWQLQKVCYKKMVAENSENDQELLLDLLITALYDQLTAEQKLTFEDLERINSEAEILLDYYFQTTIEFKATGAFYNTSHNPKKSFSGEYLLDKKKVHLEWETGDTNNCKVFKSSDKELVLKDLELKITFYYLKINNY